MTSGWAELYDWQVDREGGTPLFRQIYGQIRSGILSRTLRPGTKLPSTRELASRLGVARASVVAAYEQLFAEGYLAGRIGSGTYIAADLPEPIEHGPSALRQQPAAASRPLPSRAAAFAEFAAAAAQSDERPFNTGRSLIDARTAEIWRKLSQRALRSFGPSHLGYSDPCGLVELRRTVCEYLRAARAVRCDPDQIVVTTGTQQAIDIAIRVLLDPGDEVWVEDPCYSLTYRALHCAGVKLRPIPIDAQGIDVGAGIKGAPQARAVFVTPSHQFPLGVVLSMARRLELLAWARESGAWIIEDDYQSEFRYSGRPLASLQGLDEAARVIYAGTVNKALFPGLRIGFAVVPRALLPAFIGARVLLDRNPPSLSQAVLNDFMREGHLAAHIRRIRLLYRDQRDMLAAELAHRLGATVSIAPPDQGMHLVAYLGEGMSDVALERAARESGIVVRAISPLYREAPPRSGLMLGFSGYPRQVIVPAAARLAKIIAAQSR